MILIHIDITQLQKHTQLSGFNKKPSDYYELHQLDPGFQIIFEKNKTMSISTEWKSILDLFETIELGSSEKLEKFMDEAAFKYDFGINKLVYEPGLSLSEICKKLQKVSETSQ